MENYKLENYKKSIKSFERMYKNRKNNYKIWWYWNRNAKFNQHERPILIKNIDINKIVVSKKVFLKM